MRSFKFFNGVYSYNMTHWKEIGIFDRAVNRENMIASFNILDQYIETNVNINSPFITIITLVMFGILNNKRLYYRDVTIKSIIDRADWMYRFDPKIGELLWDSQNTAIHFMITSIIVEKLNWSE